ncbi:MAG TPA: PKD domain-containing protein [Acidimicrobiia bacterium]|nr:PKD domain-containing protein [Acidimicrobiia bacterium]
MQRFASLLAVLALGATATAQFTITVPNGTASTEGNSSNAFPWGRGGSGIRICTIYDSSNFTAQGITTPIIISQLRYRPNANASSLASTYPTGATVQLSTCPVDQGAVLAGSPLSTYVGANVTTCFSGPVSWPAAAATPGPCPWLITIPFSTNFVYDPTAGDLTIDTDIPIQTFTGTALQLDVQTTGSLSSRAYITTGYPTGTPAITQNHGVVVEITYVPAAGLYPAFTATPLTGPTGQLVQFTDQTYTSDPGGVTSYAWDVDGDSVTDYTTQNPSHTYTTEGNKTVSLTVTSAMFGTQSITKTNYISIGAVDASFTSSVLTGTLVSFTDTSTGGPTSWQWDFESDGIVDDTTQNPAFFYPAAGQYTCKLTVADAFSNDSTTLTFGIGIIPVPGFGSTFASTAATRGFWFQSPTRFSVITATVPNETSQAIQNVAIYRLAAAPPVYSLTATGGLEFAGLNQPAAAPIPCVVSFDAGEFVGVLGACGTTTMQNSYATPAGPFASSVLGQATTLTRFGTQFNINTTGADHPYWQEPGGAITRVILGVTACAAVPYGVSSPSGLGPAGPTMRGTSLPFIGQNAVHTVTNNDALVLQLMVGGFGRLGIPVPPFGTINIGSVDLIDVMNGGAPVGPGQTTWSFPVPMVPALVGQSINWQNANIVIPTGEWTLSNGIEWVIGN